MSQSSEKLNRRRSHGVEVSLCISETRLKLEILLIHLLRSIAREKKGKGDDAKTEVLKFMGAVKPTVLASCFFITTEMTTRDFRTRQDALDLQPLYNEKYPKVLDVSFVTLPNRLIMFLYQITRSEKVQMAASTQEGSFLMAIPKPRPAP